METPTYRRKSASFVFALFSVTVLVISALTSFSFFIEFFPNLIPAGVLDGNVSAIISGIIGTLLFDIASAIWLGTFLAHSETSEQRAISLAMTLVTFVGASAASIAYLGLTAGGDLALDITTRETIGLISLVTVIGGIIANFGAAQLHRRFSLDNQEAVREADRREVILTAQAKHAQHLDKLVSQRMGDVLSELAPEIAREQAERLAREFYDKEMTKGTAKAGSVRIAFNDAKPQSGPDTVSVFAPYPEEADVVYSPQVPYKNGLKPKEDKPARPTNG